MLQQIARLALAAPRRILAVAVLVLVAAAVFGLPVAKSLSAGGFQDPASESARAIKLLTDKFGQSDQQLVILVTAPAGAHSDQARRVATGIAGQVQASDGVYNVVSAWTAPSADPRHLATNLVSKDGKSGLIVANLKGGENNAQNYAKKIASRVVHDRDGVTVRAGGAAMVYDQINRQNERDLLLMESLAIPLSFLVLVWVFGGLLTAALPVCLGGLAIVAFVAVAAIGVTPAAIVLLGPRLDALDVRKLGRRILGRPDPVAKPVQELFWYRSTKFVTRRALPIGLVVVALLLMLGLPFLGVKWGMPDDRVLPASASAHAVGDQLRHDFADDSATAVSVVVPDVRGVHPGDLSRYAADLSRVVGVSAVSAPTGTFVGGNRVGPPSAATGMAQGSAFLTIASTAPLFSQESDNQLDRLHAVPGPAGQSVQLAGMAQINRDSVDAITHRLPLVLGLIGIITIVLLFLLTGS